jgi:hypothetical protein
MQRFVATAFISLLASSWLVCGSVRAAEPVRIAYSSVNLMHYWPGSPKTAGCMQSMAFRRCWYTFLAVRWPFKRWFPETSIWLS